MAVPVSRPVIPPLEPMLARPAATIPPRMVYEPKFDGFRCLVFRENDEVELYSRRARHLTPFFPELVEAILANTPPRCVLDGEIVVIVDGRFDFERLGDRIHPAQARIERLSHELPAAYVCWDVLALDSTTLIPQPLARRRELLELALAAADPPIHLAPQTTDLDVARTWFEQFEGAGLDGIVAKDPALPYRPGERAMIKVKHHRECDVVVGAYKEHRNSSAAAPVLGSLQLGLYDDAGVLHWVGVCSSFSDALRVELIKLLSQLRLEPGSDAWRAHPWSEPQTPGGPRKPGGVSRWSRDAERAYVLLDPMLVATVEFDHMQGTRFRSTTRFLRWRADKSPAECTFEQVAEPDSDELLRILNG